MRDIITQIKTQEQMYRQMANPMQGDKLRSWAAYIESLRADVETLKQHSVHFYTAGYARGHHDTVEGTFVDVHPSEYSTYHKDIVDEIIAELKDVPND